MINFNRFWRRYFTRDGKWTFNVRQFYYDLLPQFMKDYGPPLGSYNYYGYSTKPWEYVSDLWRQLKWFWQRGTRGYADNSTWSIDWYLCGWMGKALRELADNVHGVPGNDVGRHGQPPADPNEWEFLTLEEWQATIRYIADTFDLGRKIQDYDVTGDQMEAAMKRFQHGMGMFTEYFFSLWD